MPNFNKLLPSKKFEAYIEKEGSRYFLYLLIGGCKVYATERNQVKKMWYDFPKGSYQYEGRCGGRMYDFTMEEVKLESTSPSILFRTYLKEAFEIEETYNLQPLFDVCDELLFLAPITRDCLELHMFDVYFHRIVEKRCELDKMLEYKAEGATANP